LYIYRTLTAMRTYTFFIIVAALLATACNLPVAKGRNGVSFKDPVEYNDYIIARQQKVAKFVSQFVDASNVSLDSANKVLERSAKETAEFLDDISAMGAFKGDSAFRVAAVNSFTFYKRIFQEDYPKMLEINAKGEDVTDSEIDIVTKISDRLTTEETILDRRFQKAQTEFAKKNNMRLEEGKQLTGL